MSPTHLLRAAKAAHQPDWNSLDLLRDVLDELGSRPALVDAPTCDDLRRDLARAAHGETFVLQIGDCAERFSDADTAVTRRKADQLDDLAERYAELRGVPAVRIGRIAGQYAKPRSCDTEILADGTSVPVYRGDAVNDEHPTTESRRADPLRLLDAYNRSADVLRALEDRAGNDPARIYTSHEALLLEYEEVLVRAHTFGEPYGSSAHLLWAGDRTRQLDHAHVDFLASVNNPIAVKLGPSVAHGDTRALIQALDPDHRPGRLTFVARMGARHVGEHLPRVLDEIGDSATRAAWMVDPMHGNTLTHTSGQKTRTVDDILAEIDTAHALLTERGIPLAGLHLETSADHVTECLDTHEHLVTTGTLPDYRSPCDPRLAPTQALRVVEHAARLK